MKNELMDGLITPILENRKLKFLEIQRLKMLNEVTKYIDDRVKIQIQMHMNIQS